MAPITDWIFFINQIGTAPIYSAKIGSFIWSDHVPVFLELAILRRATPNCSGRLNDNLLKDKACTVEIKQTINNLVLDHIKDTTSLQVRWEALKCVLQGLYIKHGPD